MIKNALTCEHIIRMLENYGGKILGHHNEQLIVGVTKKTSLHEKAELELLCDCKIRFKILDKMDNSENAGKKVKSTIFQHTTNQKSYRIVNNQFLLNPENISLFSNDLNIYDTLNDFISQAIYDDACDIHIDRYDKKMQMQYFSSGLCREVKIQHLSVMSSLMSLLRKLVKENEIDNSDYQIGYFEVSNGIRDMYIYVSFLAKDSDEKIVLHILDNNKVIFDIDKIGLNSHDLMRLKKTTVLSSGLILVTGPPAYEKSVTYFSLLNELKIKCQRILTIEDLLEYNKTVDNKACVRKKNVCIISSVLDDFFKQKQKFILIGDLYDRETVEIAINASLNGHFVLATLNTTTVLDSIPYIMDFGVDPSLIARAVTVVMSQRKIRELCPHCKKPLKVNTNSNLQKHLHPQVKKSNVCQADGCSRCLFTGYSGSISLFELFYLSRTMAKNITSKTTVEHLRIMAEKENMKTLLQQGHELVRLGKTTIDEVISQITALNDD